MTELIVVGFDQSAASAAAFDWAATEACRRGAALRVIACYEVPLAAESGPMTASEVRAIVRKTETTVDAAVAAMRETRPDLDVSVDVVSGPARGVLRRESKGADLLVIGTSTRHGASAFWLGSTTRWLVRHLECPVVVVRDDTTHTIRPASMGTVIVGTDGSAGSDAAVLWAADQADRCGAPLRVVHCWWYPYRSTEAGPQQARDLMEVDAACVLEAAVELARGRCGAEVTGELREGSSIPLLVEGIRDGDLLVLGTPSHGRLMSALVGSTVVGILEQSPVPVVVVGATHETSAV